MSSLDEPITVSEYRTSWPLEFAAEQQRLVGAIGVAPADLEHIGSTAIPGMTAKPTIDLMLGVNEYPPPLARTRAIERLGYEALGEAGVPERLYFRLRGAGHLNLHVVRKGGPHWNNNLALRDYLRADESARERYVQVKRAAIAAGADRLLAYSAAKAELVGRLLDEALAARGTRPA